MITQSDRLSQSYPPDYTENTAYLAEVHHILAETNATVDVEKVYFQRIHDPWQSRELRLLYKEWFPLTYPDDFFDQLPNDEIRTAILALYDLEYKGHKQTIILASVLYEDDPLDLSLAVIPLLHQYRKYECIHLMALGVINEVRNKGIGTLLIKRLLDSVKEQSNFKYIYLNVITYNESAIAFYEKNGFVKKQTKEKLYEIFDKTYDGITYCLYINGGQDPAILGGDERAEYLNLLRTLYGLDNKYMLEKTEGL